MVGYTHDQPIILTEEYTMPKQPQRMLDFETHEVHEVYVDLHREALEHLAKDAQFIIIRVQVFGPNGRPSTRSLRLPSSILREPTPEWGSVNDFD